MKKTVILVCVISLLMNFNNSIYAQGGVLNKLKNTKVMGYDLSQMSLKSVATLKLMDKQFDRLEKAIAKGDYRTSASNVKYIKKGIDVIKKIDPSIDLASLESRLIKLESQIGENPEISQQRQEEASEKAKIAQFEKEKADRMTAMNKEQREREIEYAKKLKAQGADVSRNAMGKSGPNVKLDFSSARVWSGVTLQSLLETHSGLVMSLDGKLQTPKLVFSYLPPDLEGGDIPNYSSFIKEEVMVTSKVVNRTTGEELGTFYYNVNPFQNTFSTGVQHQGNGFDKVVQMKEGKYDLKFYGTGTHFFTFPFEVVKKKAQNVYSVFPEVYFIKGPWEDWAYIADSGIGGKKGLLFKFYMDYDNPDVESEYKQDIETEILFKGTIYRGSTKVGVLLPQYELANRTGEKFHRAATVTRGIWNAIGTTLVKPDWRNKDNYRHIIDMSDLLDGNYKLVLEVQDANKQYSKKTFPFKISGGKLVGHSSTTRGMHSDKYTFMEPGLGKTFIKAQ